MADDSDCGCCTQHCTHLGFNTRTAFQRTMLGLMLLGILINVSSAQNMKIDVDRMINSLDTGAKEMNEAPIVLPKQDQAPVSLMWGIADTSATVGRLFNYAIPSDAFKGNILKYKVTEAGKDTLPAWLHFSEDRKVLKGIPSPTDQGQLYLEVVTYGYDKSKAKDVFSVTVAAENPSSYVLPPQTSNEGTKPQTVRCKRELPETAVTLVLDIDLDQLPASARIAIMEKITNFLNLNMDMLKLMPLGNKPIVDNSALVTGHGDAKTPKHSGVLLSWLVGCGKVEKDHMPILHTVESSAASGNMAKALGHNVIGWHITNTQQIPKPRRRRAIRATATPVLTQSPPTKLPDQGVKDSSEPLMRSVPVMVSPTITPVIKPTKTVVMPSATPEMPDKPEVMMTAMPKPGTPSPEPKPDSTKTPILPSSPSSVTDTPTDASMSEYNCPEDGQQRPPIVKDFYKKNGLPGLFFVAGSMTTQTIPRDLFYDCKDKTSDNLGLNLFFTGQQMPPENHWLGLKFDRRRKRWVLQGLPMNVDEGRKDYILTAVNSDSLTASVKVGITVLTEDGEKFTPPNHKISLTLNRYYKNFTVHDRLAVGKKIAELYGDKDVNNVKVLSIEQGSVIYSYTNDSLPKNNCPVGKIEDLTKKLLKDDGTLRTKAIRIMSPYNLEGVAVKPLGSCVNHKSFPHKNIRKESQKTPKPEPDMTTPDGTYNVEDVTTEGPPSKASQEDSDDVWITTVVPAVVIVAILLIALLIACILYRKKRKGKMSLEDKNTFVNKGAPVIFPDEFDEKTPNESTKPLIMDDEKPPMPPPEYTRASSESSRSSDNKNEQDDIEEHEMDETDVNSPLYRPPPPVPVSGGNKTPRPHVQPAYKNTDPAILP